ncbi:hypothetical protein BJY59DRAFT_685091 [Rhodotorula toruloides]
MEKSESVPKDRGIRLAVQRRSPDSGHGLGEIGVVENSQQSLGSSLRFASIERCRKIRWLRRWDCPIPAPTRRWGDDETVEEVTHVCIEVSSEHAVNSGAGGRKEVNGRLDGTNRRRLPRWGQKIVSWIHGDPLAISRTPRRALRSADPPF